MWVECFAEFAKALVAAENPKQFEQHILQALAEKGMLDGEGTHRANEADSSSGHFGKSHMDLTQNQQQSDNSSMYNKGCLPEYGAVSSHRRSWL
jgi:hypothetical protein